MGDIFISCKRGDLVRVKTLVLEMGCDVNVSDKWNSTPLYYACFSGYESVIKFLIQAGAHYDIDSFSGGRCMNGALTDEIRNMLRHPPARKIFLRNTFKESMGFMLRDAYQLYSDICLVVGNAHHLYAHRVILCARCAYFENSLQGSNRGKYFLYFRHPKETSLAAWHQILRYIYTQELTLDKTTHPSLYTDCLHLSRRLGIPQLTALLRSKSVLLPLHKKGVDEVVVESECQYYQELAAIATSDIDPAARKQKQPFADLCFIVQKYRFYCHKAFIVAHSAYFKALLDTNKFTEVTKSNRGKLDFITLSNIDAYYFSLVIKFIYTNSTELTTDTLHDLLYYSDHYMIHGLKLACGELLETLLNHGNVVQSLALARMLRMSKLQHAALRYIASNFEQICTDLEFVGLLRHDERYLRMRRRLRVSESSLDEEEEEEDEEEGESEECVDIQCVDIRMDLRLYLRERTNKHQHSCEAQTREEHCAQIIDKILAEG